MAAVEIENSSLLALPKLIDVALNCKEGIINFFALQSLLHVIVERLNLDEVAVEFGGADRIAKPIHSTQSFTNLKKKKLKKISLQDIKEKAKKDELTEKELQIIEPRKDSKEDPDTNPSFLRSPQYSRTNATADDDATEAMQSKDAELENSSPIDKAEFLSLKDQVVKLQSTVDDLAEAKLPERVTATEQDFEQISNLVQQLANESSNPEISKKMQEMKETRNNNVKKEVKKNVASNILSRVAKLERAIFKNQTDPVDVENVDEEKSDKESEKIETVQIKFDSILERTKIEEMEPAQAVTMFLQEFNNLKTWVTDCLTKTDNKDGAATADAESDKTTVSDCIKKINNINDLYNAQIKLIRTEFETVQKELANTVSQLEATMSGGDFIGAGKEGLTNLNDKLLFFEKEILAVQEKVISFDDEKEERNTQLMVQLTNHIIEQLDVLKIIKANREDLEDALGDKADACLINRKVSHDQFDAAFDELAQGIDDALKKLQEQEKMWKETLDAIQKDVGKKIDKNEVDPLKEFVNSKLKALQEKFKSLTALREERDAAGTKSKLLRNVNCISCDKDVVMCKEVDITLKPKPYAIPPNRSMAPYLAYELDQLRKQQICTPSSKNLNCLEHAIRPQTLKKKDHLCNRYCGGSHTLTTPQQRVQRVGHFLEQWSTSPRNISLNKEKQNNVTT